MQGRDFQTRNLRREVKSMTKYVVGVFYDAPLGFVYYRKATEAKETLNGGLVFLDADGDTFTISHQIPWYVVIEKEEQK